MQKGNVSLFANADGFEHIAGYFLKMARTGKRHGLDAHHTLEFDKRPEAPELRLLLNPNYFQAYPARPPHCEHNWGFHENSKTSPHCGCSLPASLGLYWQCS